MSFINLVLLQNFLSKSSAQQLVKRNSKGPNVNFPAVAIFLVVVFGGHVLNCSTIRELALIRTLYDGGEAKVDQFNLEIVAENVARFDVTMDDVHLLKIAKNRDQLYQDESSLFFI